MESQQICDKLVHLVFKALLIDKNNYRFMFHDSVVMFIDKFHVVSSEKGRFESRDKNRFILTRIAAHMNPKLISYATQKIFVSHSMACLVENVHQVSVFER